MTRILLNCLGVQPTNQSWAHSCHLSTSQHPGSHPQRSPHPSSLPTHRASSSATTLESHQTFSSCGRPSTARVSISAPPTRAYSTAKSVNMPPITPSFPETSSDMQWHSLTEPIWAGSEADALATGSRVHQLAPPWKVMLLSDGSVTRHLQLLTGVPVTVECLQMADMGTSPLGLPPAAALLEGDLLQRQVFLRQPAEEGWPASSGRALVYATSWWQADKVQKYLVDTSAPIWVNLSRGHIELYREIQSLQLGHSKYLEEQFGRPGPFWGRQYLFWHKGEPLTIIHEVFSPVLDEYLGAMERSSL